MRTLLEIAVVIILTIAIFITGFCVPEFGIYSVYSGIGFFIIGLFIVYYRATNRRTRQQFQQLFVDTDGNYTYETI